jgi:hypothetical protein
MLLNFAAESSREIGWWEAGPPADFPTGKVVYSRIVRRFNLLCSENECTLTVLSLPARNCADEKSISRGPVLESSSPGSDVAVFEMHKDGSGDLSVRQIGKDSVSIEFASPESPFRATDRILVITEPRSPGSAVTETVTKLTGNEAGVGVDHVARNFEYRLLPLRTVCVIRVNSP